MFITILSSRLIMLFNLCVHSFSYIELRLCVYLNEYDLRYSLIKVSHFFMEAPLCLTKSKVKEVLPTSIIGLHLPNLNIGFVVFFSCLTSLTLGKLFNLRDKLGLQLGAPRGWSRCPHFQAGFELSRIIWVIL